MANATCRGSFRRFQKHRSAMHHQQCVSLTLPIAFDYALLMCFLGWFLHIHKHEHKNVSSLSRRLSLSTVTVVVIPIITTTIILTYSYYHCAILCLIGSFYLSLFRLTPAQETGKKRPFTCRGQHWSGGSGLGRTNLGPKSGAFKGVYR